MQLSRLAAEEKVTLMPTAAIIIPPIKEETSILTTAISHFKQICNVIEEIEDRMHDKLQNFQDSFFGSVGAMTKRAKDLDPMNGIRKAAKDGDWTSMLVEYAANKSGLGAFIHPNQQKLPKEKTKES